MIGKQCWKKGGSSRQRRTVNEVFAGLHALRLQLLLLGLGLGLEHEHPVALRLDLFSFFLYRCCKGRGGKPEFLDQRIRVALLVGPEGSAQRGQDDEEGDEEGLRVHGRDKR